MRKINKIFLGLIFLLGILVFCNFNIQETKAAWEEYSTGVTSYTWNKPVKDTFYKPGDYITFEGEVLVSSCFNTIDETGEIKFYLGTTQPPTRPADPATYGTYLGKKALRKGGSFYVDSLKVPKDFIGTPEGYAYARIYFRGRYYRTTYIIVASERIRVNHPPLANAGPDKEVFWWKSVVLEGSGSDPEGDPITFSWSCSGGQLSNSHIAQPTYTAPWVIRDSTYTCTLTVSDDKGGRASDSMNVLVKNNYPPRANAGPDKEVFWWKSVVLEGSGSDPEGDPITFSWSCSGGQLSNSHIAQPTYTAPWVIRDSTYTCTLTVSDDKGGRASDSMNVLVKNNYPPRATSLQAKLLDGCPACHYVFSWTFSDPGDSQSAYQVQVDNNSNFSSPEVDSKKIPSESTSFAPISPLSWNTEYYWRLMVWDSKDLSSSWIIGPSFTTPHAYPEPDFSWQPVRPSRGEVVIFDSGQTKTYGGTTISAYLWTITEGVGEFVDGTNNSSANPHLKFSTQTNKIKLKVTDSTGYSCESPEKTLTATLPLPQWKEIPPL